jgi:hypothetical protein
LDAGLAVDGYGHRSYVAARPRVACPPAGQELNIARSSVEAGWRSACRDAFALFTLGKVTAGFSGILQGEGLHADD